MPDLSALKGEVICVCQTELGSRKDDSLESKPSLLFRLVGKVRCVCLMTSCHSFTATWCFLTRYWKLIALDLMQLSRLCVCMCMFFEQGLVITYWSLTGVRTVFIKIPLYRCWLGCYLHCFKSQHCLWLTIQR